MEYYYTRNKAAVSTDVIQNLIIKALILLAGLVSFAAKSHASGCNMTAAISWADVACNGGSDGSATVIMNGGTAPYSYVWSSVPVQTTATAIGLAAGAYSVTVTDISGCTTTATVTLSEPSTPLTISVTGTYPTCPGHNGTATAVAGGGIPPYSYAWNSSPAQSTSTATGLDQGNYSITITDANNCSLTSGIMLDTTLPVTAVITGPDTICQDQDYPHTFTLHATGGTSYQWSNGSTSNATLITPTTTTTYSVIVSNGSCSDTAYFTVTVYLVPHAWVSGPSSSCAGDTVMLTAYGGASFMWSTGDTTSSIHIDPMTSTTYSVVVTNGVCPDTVAHAITVNSPELVIQGCSAPCANSGEMTYMVPPVNGAISYTWSVPAGWAIISGQNTNSITVSTGDASADGNISLVTAGGSCANYNISFAADVTECADELVIPNTFTPNNDGHNDTWEIPNIGNYPGNEISILNRWGNELYRMTNYDNKWDGKDLDEGTYFYVVKVKTAGSDKGCAVEGSNERLYKGYVMIVREK
jgi:gliding motility-associated-like protein